MTTPSLPDGYMALATAVIERAIRDALATTSNAAVDREGAIMFLTGDYEDDEDRRANRVWFDIVGMPHLDPDRINDIDLREFKRQLTQITRDVKEDSEW